MKINKASKELFFVGLTAVLVPLFLFFIYIRTNWYIVHPSLYLIVLLMGMGWTLTAIASFKTK